ncbi:MAG: hypothetical protein ACRELC_03765, partial [Gemmatimonadota bacterium]
MSATLKADGDRWVARLGDTKEGVPTRPVLFFCTTTDQRPYRVVEVEADRFGSDDDVKRLPEAELRALFAASHSMGVPREYPSYG